MTTGQDGSSATVLKGVSLAALGFGMFALQDAIVKWLATRYPIPEILFMRSVVIVAGALILARGSGKAPFYRSPNKLSLVTRAVLLLTAWMLYYSASRTLGLAELTTLYFIAPIVVVALSVWMLGETVNLSRWLIVAFGFGGVVLAASPSASVDIGPAILVLIAALCWALNAIFVRLISRTESTANQILASNALFVIACAATFPWAWETPDALGWTLMIGLGVIGGAGQYFLFEGFRLAPASAIAPVEYSGLVWAFVLGTLVFGEVPALSVFIGAAVIVASCLALVATERRN